MTTWRERAGRAAAAGAIVAALLMAPTLAFAADGAVPPSEPTPTTEPAPVPPDTTTPAEAPVDTPLDTPADTPVDTPAETPSDALVEPPAALLTPSVTVTPSTDLVHLQSVTITGTGFTPNTAVGWAECKNNNSGSGNDCDVNHTGIANTDASGAFSAPFTVRRTLHTANGDVDCAAAPGTCNLGVGKLSDYDEHAGAPLAFDPNAPLPPPPTLLALPTSDLREGDSVVLAGAGFVPNSPAFIVQCLQASPQNCQTLSNVQADGAGGFLAIAQVHRNVATPPFNSTDCASAPGTCQLTAVSIADYDFHASVLLDFDPNGPQSTAATTVTPDTGLLNFEQVTVAGTGFTAGAGAQVIECKSNATSYDDCVQSIGGFASVNASGAFSIPLTVRRVLHLPGGDFDCATAPGACSLVASSFGGVPIVVAHPISFDDSVPPPPAPSVSVTPSTDLVQGQSVTVTGAGFAPNDFVTLTECLDDDQYAYCAFGGAGVPTDATGAFSTTFTVRRGVPDFSDYPPNIVDCAGAPQRCAIVASSYQGGDRADQEIDFDPSAPIAVPDLSVTPQFDLADRAVVNVHSSGFAPGERVVVSQCPADASTYPFSCTTSFFPEPLVADANGVVDTALRVRRELPTPDGVVIIAGLASCADSVGACVIRVQSIDDPLVMQEVPLGFDPTAVAPPPVLSVATPGPYADGQEVVVHGSGFTPNGVLGMAQCKSEVDSGGSTCDSGDNGLFSEFRADGDGAFTRTVTMHTEVQTTDGPLDCSPAGACVLFAANRSDYGVERASVPIEFTAPVAPIEVAGISATRALAFTGAGSSTAPIAVAGFTLLLVGGLLVVVSRRRRLT